MSKQNLITELDKWLTTLEFNDWEKNFLIEIKTRIECNLPVSQKQLDKLRYIVTFAVNAKRYKL